MDTTILKITYIMHILKQQKKVIYIQEELMEIKKV